MNPTESNQPDRNPTPTADDLAVAFRRADQARQAIARIVAGVRSGEVDLAGAFGRADADPLVARCFAVKVFEAVPGIGKVQARRTMESLGLAEDLALGEVPAARRNEIVEAFVAEPDSAP